MRGQLLAGIFVLGWLSAGVAGASELPGKIAAMCVQGQLNALGYPVGTIDGQIGPRSIAAAERYAAESKLETVGALSAATAELWCRALAAHDPKLVAFLDRAEEAAELAGRSYGTADDFRYDIAANVPADEVDVIKRTTAMAETYLMANFGSGIPEAKRKRITIKIVATGKGNQEHGGGGGVATAFAGTKQRPFFDVAHVQWNQNSQGRGWTNEADSMKTVAHEYAHIWQGELGAISGSRQPLPGWVNEGIAEYLGYRVIVDAGLMNWENVRPFVLNGAMQDQLGTPLDKITAWPGHAGFLAIDWLVESSPNGLPALRQLGEAVGEGRSTKAAFYDAFGLELDDFYAQFEAWRPLVVRNPGQAFAIRPKLIMAN
ncbi:MAG: hypothetical protein EOP22_15280 [Hyphomicrobiales bacterium]|nr:MAG: hypothetical protein EOP22_15280 [Hyphomicrobiales bacterium]